MIVMYGDPHTLILAITEKEITDLREGKGLTWEPGAKGRMLIQNVLVMWGRDERHVVSTLRASGIPISPVLEQKYLAGERTDTPKKPS